MVTMVKKKNLFSRAKKKKESAPLSRSYFPQQTQALDCVVSSLSRKEHAPPTLIMKQNSGNPGESC